jgi:hypothetical protein
VPKTPEEFALYFRNSLQFDRLREEVELYKVRKFVGIWRALVILKWFLVPIRLVMPLRITEMPFGPA